MNLDLINNLWVLFSGMLVFLMAISVGFLEIGELGKRYENSLLKTMIITSGSIVFMAFIGFDIAFAPTYHGFIGVPTYSSLLLGMFSPNATGIFSGVFWMTDSAHLATYLATGTVFFFEAACASVTLALVAVVILRKVKLMAFAIYSVVYFTIIWTIPVSWIWNPSGWLYTLGVRDFAGGLLVHGAAAVAALGIMVQIWIEEKKSGLKTSSQVHVNINNAWLTLAILLLWLGWFGFNPGTELGLNYSTIMILLVTFLSGSAGMLSTMFFKYLETRENPGMLYAVNGTLIGLVVITPLAGFVSPGSAIILGIISGPLFIAGEKIISRARWFTDPVGVLSVHGVGGIFGILMIGVFSQNAFASESGFSSIPNGLLFGGGFAALNQIGLEIFGIIIVSAFVFLVSFASSALISRAMHGILSESGQRLRDTGASTSAHGAK